VSILTNSLAANDVAACTALLALAQTAPARRVKLWSSNRGGSNVKSGLFGSSGASLHTKAMVMDGSRVFVGSYNIDPRSTSLNTEQECSWSIRHRCTAGPVVCSADGSYACVAVTLEDDTLPGLMAMARSTERRARRWEKVPSLAGEGPAHRRAVVAHSEHRVVAAIRGPGAKAIAGCATDRARFRDWWRRATHIPP